MNSTYLLTAIYNDPQPKTPAPRRIGTDRVYRDLWIAIDLDRYDGAEDGDTTTGTGKTESEAIRDLLDQYEEQS